jgi:hypothetical protein
VPVAYEDSVRPAAPLKPGMLNLMTARVLRSQMRRWTKTTLVRKKGRGLIDKIKIKVLRPKEHGLLILNTLPCCPLDSVNLLHVCIGPCSPFRC